MVEWTSKESPKQISLEDQWLGSMLEDEWGEVDSVELFHERSEGLIQNACNVNASHDWLTKEQPQCSLNKLWEE